MSTIAIHRDAGAAVLEPPRRLRKAAAEALPLADGWHPGHSPWVIAVTVTLATFMEVLDTSIANVALPHIAGSLSATVDESTWVLTSYLVSNAIVLPLCGWLSSVFGRKRFYMTCVVLFTASSALCGFAPSLGWLVVCRILQGIGGGGLAPSEQAILVDTFPPAKRGMGMAVYGVAVVVAPIVGPTLGGWITDNYSWRWIFFINIPVGVLSLILTSQFVSDPPYLKREKKKSGLSIDYIGLALVAIGLGFMQIVLDKGQREDWFASGFIVVCTAICILAVVGGIVWELRCRNPVVDLRLLKERNFLISTILMFMLGFVLYGSTVLLPIYLQTLMGYSATWSGLVLSPGGFITMATMPLAGFLLSKVQPRWLTMFGLTVLGLATLHMAGFNLNTDFHTAMMSRVYQSIGLAFLFLPLNAAAFDYLPKEKNNAASGLINLARNLGGSFGIAFVATVLARRAQFHQNVLSSHTSVFNPQWREAVASLTHWLQSLGMTAGQATQTAYGLLYGTLSRHANMLAFIDDFWLLGVMILAMVPLVLAMRKTRPLRDGVGRH